MVRVQSCLFSALELSEKHRRNIDRECVDASDGKN